jgi:S1-C subfamily serine protease
VTIYRDGEEMLREVDTVALDGFGVDRIVLWAGALLQAPHRELAAQRGLNLGGVYVAYFNFGSPSSRSGLFAGSRIVAVDGRPTTDLDQFVAAVADIENRDSVRLNTVNWNNVPEVITLKLDDQYWPAYQLVRNAYEWSRQPLN